MQRRDLALTVVLLAWAAALILLLCAVQGSRAASPDEVPTIADLAPRSGPNDLDTPIIITGTGFTAVPTIYLGSAQLDAAVWVSSTRLSSTVPWGLAPGSYTMTLVNPDGMSTTLPQAFSVTQGLGVWTTGGPYGGSVWHVSTHPITPSQVYASADATGIFASSDAGASWELMFLHGLSTGRLSFDAQDPDTIYFSNNQAYRTTNGGRTWDYLDLPDPNLQEFHIVAHPISAGVAYAGTAAPDYRPIAPGEEGQLYRLENAGEDWTAITSGLTDTHVTALAFHPEDPASMLVGTRNGHLFVSRDGGDTWQWAARVGSHIAHLYFNPFGKHEAWATTAPAFGPNEAPYVLKSMNDDWTLWQPVTVTEDSAVFALTFHPITSGTLWAATRGIYTSIDGGKTWAPLSPDLPTVQDISVDPADPDVLYAGVGDRGVLKSVDGGDSWQVANEGLAGVVPSYLAVSWSDPYEVYAYDHALGLLKSQDGGGSWRTLDFYRCGIAWAQNPLATDPFSPTRIYMGESWTPQCGSGPQGNAPPSVRISADRGESWHVVTMTIPAELDGWSGDTYALAPHPSQAGRLLAGVTFVPDEFDWTYTWHPRGGIYASDDYGQHWTQIALSQSLSGVLQISFAPSDPWTVYAGTGGTGLLRSDDGGLNWQPTTRWPGDQGVHSFAIHPQDSDIVHITTGESLYVTQDGGTTWIDLELDPNEYGPLFYRPGQPSVLYAGGCCGAKQCPDGWSWSQVPGIPREATVRVFGAGTSDDRTVVYVGMSGGVLPADARVSRASDTVPGLGSVVGGGVYRLTTRLHGRWIYLPIVLR